MDVLHAQNSDSDQRNTQVLLGPALQSQNSIANSNILYSDTAYQELDSHQALPARTKGWSHEKRSKSMLGVLRVTTYYHL